jgi:hypothetical protein
MDESRIGRKRHGGESTHCADVIDLDERVRNRSRLPRGSLKLDETDSAQRKYIYLSECPIVNM